MRGPFIELSVHNVERLQHIFEEIVHPFVGLDGLIDYRSNSTFNYQNLKHAGVCIICIVLHNQKDLVMF